MSWRTLRRDRLGEVALSPLDLYAEKLRSYDSFAEKLGAAGIGFSYLRFEDIVARQREVFDEISPRLRSPASEVACIEGSTKDRRLTRSDYIRRYCTDEWRGELLASPEPVRNGDAPSRREISYSWTALWMSISTCRSMSASCNLD